MHSSWDQGSEQTPTVKLLLDIIAQQQAMILRLSEEVVALNILASKKFGTLYIGVTGDLIQHIHAHKENLADGFTKK